MTINGLHPHVHTPVLLTRRSLFAGVLLAALPLTPSGAAVPLEQTDTALRQALSIYFRSLTTMRARITQTVFPSEKVDHGSFLLRRPGLMRIDYDPPNPLQIIADGRNLILINRQTRQRTEVPLSLTPAAYIVGSEPDLSPQSVSFLDYAESAKELAVRLSDAKNVEKGSIALWFDRIDRQNLRLSKWRIFEPNGNSTEVALVDPETSIDLPRRLFSG